MKWSSIVGLLLLAMMVGSSFGHSYLTKPTSRSNQKQSNNGCRGPACLGPCDVPKARATTAAMRVQRGQNVSIEWPRNNHAGGFVRLAWAPFDKSDTHSVFDDNVHKIVCHERGGCGPDSASNPNGGDSGPSDGSSRACKTQITIPGNLADGKWTLQWSWWGGAFALGDYYSCVDMQVSGGPSGKRKDPFFQGGDYSFPNQPKCKYFNTDALHVCVNEPCNNPPKPGEHSGAPAQRSLWGSRSSTTGSTTGTNTGTTTGGNTEGSTSKTFEWTDGGKRYSMVVTVPGCSEMNKTSAKIMATLTTPDAMESVSMMGQYASGCNVSHCDCSQPMTVTSDSSKKVWKGTRAFNGPENSFNIYVMYKAPSWSARRQYPEDHLPHLFMKTPISCGAGKKGPCVQGICWKAIGVPGCV